VALRPRLRLVKGGGSVEVIALVNSGYETREPEVLVPASIAAQLSLSGDESGALAKEYKLADGSTTRLLRIPRAGLVYASGRPCRGLAGGCREGDRGAYKR
jgi:hypothetical protein